ncbi:MAG: TlpA disulfide reductase family protein [Planctomycetota bacterium]
MLPQERALVRRLADKPFTLLGINSDESRSVLQKVIREQDITWPNLYDGSGAAGRIAQAWNVRAWPTLYLLDHEGVIRCRDPEEAELEKRIIELLERVPPASGRERPRVASPPPQPPQP